MLKPLISISLLLLLSACASTDTTKSQQSNSKSMPSVTDGSLFFLDQKDGTKYQPTTGLHCPASVMGIPMISTKSYNDAGTDVSCGYQEGKKTTTIYLTEISGATLDQIFSYAKQAIAQGRWKEKLEYQEEMTNSCMLDSQLLSGLSGLLDGNDDKKDKTITIDMSGNGGNMPYKIAIYGGSSISTYVAVSPIDDKIMKIRHSVDTPISEDQASKDCKAIHRLMRDSIASVGKPKGGKAPASLYDLISDDDS